MLGWLANLLIKSSVVGSSCPCCQEQNEQRKQMQRAVLNGEIRENIQDESCFCEHGQCLCEERDSHPFKNVEEQNSEMKMVYRYKI